MIAIHKFFNDWESTITEALDLAGDLITPIIDSIDRRKAKKTNVSLNVALSVLSVGLFLIPAIGPFAEVSAAGVAAANVGLNAVKAAPAVAQGLFPQGKGDPPQQYGIDNAIVLKTMITKGLRENIQMGLRLVQGVDQKDVRNFLAFASWHLLVMAISRAAERTRHRQTSEKPHYNLHHKIVYSPSYLHTPPS